MRNTEDNRSPKAAPTIEKAMNFQRVARECGVVCKSEVHFEIEPVEGVAPSDSRRELVGGDIEPGASRGVAKGLLEAKIRDCAGNGAPNSQGGLTGEPEPCLERARIAGGLDVRGDDPSLGSSGVSNEDLLDEPHALVQDRPQLSLFEIARQGAR